ncbi:MAG TPA: EamA family transporter [Clostridia bacterium]
MSRNPGKPPATPIPSARGRAIAALVGCAILWSLGGILIKSISLNAFAVSGGRSMVAVVFFIMVYGVPRRPRKPAFWGAIFAYAGTMLLFVTATKLTSAANAILLQYTAPVFVCLFGWLLFRERLTALDLAATALVMGGMVLFFLDGLSISGGAARIGNLLAIGSGICFGLQAVLMRRLRLSGSSPESALTWGNLVCFAVAIPFFFVKTPTSTDILLLAGMGLVQVGIAYVLYAYALKYVTSLELILIPILEPLLNPFWVFAFRGEKPGWTVIVGGSLILAIITGWCILRGAKARAGESAHQTPGPLVI